MSDELHSLLYYPRLAISWQCYYRDVCIMIGRCDVEWRWPSWNGRGEDASESDVREHGPQLFLGVIVVFGPKERVDHPQRVLRGAVVDRLRRFGRGPSDVRPEPPVDALPELDHALRHHVARAVLELIRAHKRAHDRPRGRRVGHHAAHRRHAHAPRLAQRLLELVWPHVVADHVPRNRLPFARATKPFGHLVGRGLPPHLLERLRVDQFVQRTWKQHLRARQHKPRVSSAYPFRIILYRLLLSTGVYNVTLSLSLAYCSWS